MAAPWVKVCGITSVEDAIMVADLGVEAIGLNFVAESPRAVTLKTAKTISAALPPHVLRVGVFNDVSEITVDRIADEIGLDRLQLHGDLDPDWCARRSTAVIKAFRSSPGWDPGSAEPFRRYHILLDGYHPGMAGGTGRLSDWSVARALVEKGFDVILAGGLNPSNLAAAVETVQPAAVDLNSGVESAPGRKDRARLMKALEALGRR
jgi:phosphoribosylanthranilate isomerase